MIQIFVGDVFDKLAELPDESIHCVVTSPPYWGLRDYGVAGQIGLEPTIDEYVAKIVKVFHKVWRVLRKDGTVWLNIGDAYTSGGRTTYRSGASQNKGHHCQNDQPRPSTPDGLKPKDLVMMSARVALALQSDGWYLRSEIVWHKTQPMPESVTDRPTCAHEKIFLFAKSQKYYFDAEAVKEKCSEDTHARYARGRSNNHKYAHGGPGDQTIARSFEHMVDKQSGHGRRYAGFNDRYFGRKLADPGSGIKNNSSMDAALAVMPEYRNIRNVWTLPSMPFSGAHFAVMPTALVEPCIKAGCPVGGVVLDPFAGSGTVGLVADRLRCDAVLIELNPEYAEMARRRINQDAGMFAQVEHQGSQVVLAE